MPKNSWAAVWTLLEEVTKLQELRDDVEVERERDRIDQPC